MKYTETDLVKVAQRENNTKRGYLLVNPLQGKHIPVSPTKVYDLFTDLSLQLKGHYQNETILFVGFAETATAIGACVALNHGGYYVQTTREEVENVTFFDFSESHSHATQQKLTKTDIDQILPSIQRIIFVEDEVTTGNTIMNIIQLLRNSYENPPQFSVLSILNGMEPDALHRYHEESIPLHYLLKTDHTNYPEIASRFTINGTYYPYLPQQSEISPSVVTCTKDYVNTRRVVKSSDYQLACESLWRQIEENCTFPTDSTEILVLGTEEFMFPPLFVAKKLEELGHKVKFHATTRSPIAVSTQDNYPLHTRWSLPSVYENDRKNFVYNLTSYQQILLLTDSNFHDNRGFQGILYTLQQQGNNNITMIRWCTHEK